MATSLAKQLQNLAVPQTRRLQQEYIIAKSLLFEPQKAASLEREQFFAIGLTGLEELEHLLPELSKFHSTLFSESSKMLERSVQTAQANEKLSNEIDSFLCMVSPFMLLKPSLKALEWLVHRFQIHLYNEDSLMKCILPYHETKAFVKVIQLLELNKQNGRWYWLLPLQKAGMPLAKLTLFNHCFSDNGFLKFICRIAKQAAKNIILQKNGLLRTTMLFYTSTVIGALECAKTVSEEAIATIIPYLVAGLGSDQEDYVASSYTLFAYLAQKTLVLPDILHNLFLVMLQSVPVNLTSKAVECIQVVMESQKMEDLPTDCINYLMKPDVDLVIAELSQHYNMSRLRNIIMDLHIINVIRSAKLMTGKGTRIYQKKSSDCLRFLRSAYMGDEDVTFTIRKLLTTHLSVIQDTKNIVNPRLQEFSIKVLTVLETRYPIVFDRSIEEVVDKLGSEAQTLIQKLLCHADSKVAFEPSLGAPLLTSLHHPNDVRRQMAVEVLNAKLETLGLEDEKLVELVTDRLKDTSALVVDVVVNSQNLLNRLPPDALVPILLQIVIKQNSEKDWYKVKTSAMEALNKIQNCSDENATLMVKSILPLMFPSSAKGIPMARLAATNNLLQNHHMYCEIWQGMAKLLVDFEIAGLAKFHGQLLNCVVKGLFTMSPEERVSLLKFVMADDCNLQRNVNFNCVLLPLLVGEVLALGSTSDLEVSLAQDVLKFVDTRLDAALKKSKAEFDWSMIGQCTSLEFLQSVIYENRSRGAKSLFLGSLVFSLANVTRGMANAKTTSTGIAFHCSFFKHVTDWMHKSDASSKMPFQELLRFWIKTCFGDEKRWINFLLLMIAENTELDKSSPVIQVRCMRLLAATIASVTRPVDTESEKLPGVFPFVLALSNSQSENVRRAALQCLTSMMSSEWVQPAMLRLAKKILASKDEILCDGEILNIVLKKCLLVKKTSKAKDTGSTISTILDWITSGSIPDVIKEKLLMCLNGATSSGILERLIPYLDTILRPEKDLLVGEHSIVCQILKLIMPVSAPVFDVLPSAKATFQLALVFSRMPPHSSLPTIQKVAMQQMTKHVYRATASAQQDFLKMLIDLQVNSTDSEVIRTAGKVLRKLPFNGEQALVELKSGINSFAVLKSVKEVKGQLRNPKKAASEGQKAADTPKDLSRRRLLVILEAIQGKRHFKDSVRLIPILFAYLKQSLELETESDYDKQLLLMSLRKCCDQLTDCSEHLDKDGSGQNQINIELVVKCIRTTSNPRIHHHALLLLSSIAKLFPEYVLHNTMAIFTFMGANVFRHDDSYSFNVITKTVESIIPPILETRRHTGDSIEETKLIISLTRIFVDALPDIPEHRRIPLFRCFLASLKDNGYLWLITSVILQSYVTWDTRNESNKRSTVDKRSVLDFARHFCHQHLPNDQIATCNRLIGHIVVVTNSEGDDTCEDEMYLQLHSLKQRHHYLLLVVEFVASLLGSEEFLGQVIEMTAESGSAGQDLYEILLRQTLECVKHFGTCAKVSTSTNPSAAKYWKLMVHRTYELLDRSASLIPEIMFVDVIKALVNDENLSLQCKAIEMLVAKLQRIGTDPSKVDPFVKIVPDFLAILRRASEEPGSNSTQQIVNKQMIFLAFKHLSRLVASKHPEQFKKVLIVTMDLLCHQNMHEHLYSSALLCLAELCQTLQVHVIVHLPRIMPAIMAISEDIVKIAKNELLLLSVVTAIHRVVESLPHFLSPYLHSILLKVCQLSTVIADNPKSPLATRLKSIRQNLAQEVSLRILLPAIQSCYDQCAVDQRGAVQCLMQTLSEAIKVADKDVAVWHDVLLSFFLKALDYRASHPQDSAENIAAIEECVAEPLTVLVIKMSEASFRPFFIKLFDWATRESSDRERALVFYFMADKIADRLKSLFILFAGHFIRNAATLLDENNTSKSDLETLSEKDRATSSLLVRHILDCLHKCFLYDNEGFVNKERFETLSEPLVDQIESGVESEDYSNHISHLNPCVAQLAVAANNDMLWKTLSYKVLLKTRHSSTKVRFAALQMIQELARKLGEEFNTLLPETIPFLAELMEDESVEVEQLCQTVIADIEVILGQPLQEYFAS